MTEGTLTNRHAQEAIDPQRMFGYRARIGYTAPPVFIETFPYEFYRMAPAGVTLCLTTLSFLNGTREEYQDSFTQSLEAAKSMASAGVSIVVLGGASPLEAVLELNKVDQLITDTEAQCGVPITTALTAQIHALKAVGARKIATVLPGKGGRSERLEYFGFEHVGTRSANRTYHEFGGVSLDEPAEFGRAIIKEYPEADTLFYPAAHWPAAGCIETLEQELGITVISSAQAIVWEALRRCNIQDQVEGYGRLLRDY
jgi:maleate isomerase